LSVAQPVPVEALAFDALASPPPLEKAARISSDELLLATGPGASLGRQPATSINIVATTVIRKVQDLKKKQPMKTKACEKTS